MTISRRLPQGTESIWAAIQKATERTTNPPPYGNIVTAPTTTRLDALAISYSTARTDVFVKQALSSLDTAGKDEAMAFQRMINSQYIQGLNFSIDQKICPPSYRSFFGIAVNSGSVPDQKSETAVATLAQNIISGEALMILAGGVAISFPLVSSIQSHYLILQAKNKKHNDALDALDLAKETILTLYAEAYAVIKKTWDEVETYYDEGTMESKRKNARLWGVMYANTGDPVTLTGHIMEMVNGAPVAVVGAKATILESEETATSLSEGALVLRTTMVGTITIRLSMDSFADKDLIMDIDSAKNVDLGIIVMVKMVK